MPIPLIVWIAGGLAAATVLGGGQESTSVTITKLGKPTRKATIGKLEPIGGAPPPSQPPPRPTGPLPAAALAAWNAPKSGRRNSRSAYGPDNDIHKKGSWLRYATYSKNWDKKLAKTRFYAKPNGAMFVKSTSKLFNLAWMMRAPESWYPGNGRAKRRNARVSALKLWLGPKADWDTFKGMFKDSIAAIPDLIKGAKAIVAGVTSGGGSLAADPDGQVEDVIDSIKAGLEPLGNVGGSASKRLKAAKVVVEDLGEAYLVQLREANPWVVMPDGSISIGKNFHPEPKTYEDLFDRSYIGKGARPLLWNP